ncbi:unnamed protein product [Haemonchus placei]|uniref:SKA2 domain-containing protein n=1 Tax=Haemonchus placei TaxID=6290 RepID=A0A0N4WX64_HAEPC|nr:unnamed protein product [Haemonchus placei]
MSVDLGMNSESARVLSLLEEIKETQNEILEKMAVPNEAFNMELERLNSLVSF